MTQREKILAVSVVLVILSFAAIWGLQSVSSAFDTRYDELAKWEQDVAEKQAKIRRGKIATAQLKAWEEFSLPSDVNRAQTQYRVWLHSLTQKAGLQVEVKPHNEKRYGNVFVLNSFQVAGKGDLMRLNQFLHDFYNTGFLHRVSGLTVTPVPDKKELDIILNIDALSLNQAPKEKETAPPPAKIPLEKDAKTYAVAIVNRNVFAPANNPPRFSSLSTQRGNPNRSLTFSVKATDPDKLDQLTYALESPALDGAKIDPKTGEFRWTPTKLGEDYEAIVRVTDDGTPPKSVTEKIKIAVVDAPPPAKENPFLKDDPARDAHVSGVVGSGSIFQVWVTVPRGLGDQPKTLHLNSGDKISVGSFVGVVKDIREREAEFQLTDGRTVVIRDGQRLVSSERGSEGLE